MIYGLKSKKNFVLLIFFFTINILFSKQNYKRFKLTIPLEDDNLGKLYMSVNDNYILSKNKEKLEECEWVPSLVNPILLVPQSIILSEEDENTCDIKITNSILFTDSNFAFYKFDYDIFGIYNLVILRPSVTDIGQNCYFGLSCGFSQYTDLNVSDYNLNNLGDSGKITKKIFSFSKWPLNNSEEIISYLYFGDNHEDFNSNEGIIGTCDSDKEDPFWGCNFSSISFNNKTKELKKKSGDYYKIFFSSEIYDILIPQSFQEDFNNITKDACKENELKEMYCEPSFFKNREYAEIELIYKDKMNITIEIDSVNRFLNENQETKYKTRLIFGDYQYFILPLIMFKNFHIQFDAENYKINFYTNDSRILQVKVDEKKEDNKKGSSKTGTVFLIIFIILILIALIFGLIWLIRKRRNSVEKNINKYNKFEDEENFQDMNEKRVF